MPSRSSTTVNRPACSGFCNASSNTFLAARIPSRQLTLCCLNLRSNVRLAEKTTASYLQYEQVALPKRPCTKASIIFHNKSALEGRAQSLEAVSGKPRPACDRSRVAPEVAAGEARRWSQEVQQQRPPQHPTPPASFCCPPHPRVCWPTARLQYSIYSPRSTTSLRSAQLKFFLLQHPALIIKMFMSRLKRHACQSWQQECWWKGVTCEVRGLGRLHNGVLVLLGNRSRACDGWTYCHAVHSHAGATLLRPAHRRCKPQITEE